jgi:hypothetical protein
MKKILIALFAIALFTGVHEAQAQSEEKAESQKTNLRLEETKMEPSKSNKKMKGKKQCGKAGKKSCCEHGAMKTEKARKED